MMASGWKGARSEQIEILRSPGAIAGMPDQQLLGRFTARQDESAELAFAELVRRHGPLVLGACRQLLRDPHDAEDAFQTTFLVLARKADSIRRPELLAHWLYGVAIHVARKAKSLNERRERHEGREVAMWDAEPIGDPGRHELRLVRREEVEALHEELARLPEKYRLPVVLCDLGGLTHAEAAGRLRWPTGSLSVRLMRARELLCARLTRRGLAPTSALLATVALPETSSAAVPPDLAEATVRAALQCVRGYASTAGGVSASVSTLTGHVLTAMARPQLTAVATALVGALIAIMVGLLTLDSPSRGDFPGGWRTDSWTEARPDPQARTGHRRRPAEGAGAIVGDARVQSGGTDDAPDGATWQGEGWKTAPEPPPGDALAAYHDLVKRSGGDADTQVRLALWCEASGLGPERLKHLALAVLTDPGHATARGLLGHVAVRGRWRRPEDLDELLRGDTQFSAALAEYDVRRDRMEDTADAHWRLALWCEQKGLEAEAWAHFAAVTRREPAREAAWRRLGYTRHHGRWMRPEQIAAETSALEAQRKADRHWKPLLSRWKWALKEDSRRAWAEAKLAGVTDPRVVPAIWEAFAGGGPDDQGRAARLLAQVDGSSATRALALLAVFGDSAEIRRVATETLARRRPARRRRPADRPPGPPDPVRGAPRPGAGRARHPVRCGGAIQRPAAVYGPAPPREHDPAPHRPEDPKRRVRSHRREARRRMGPPRLDEHLGQGDPGQRHGRPGEPGQGRAGDPGRPAAPGQRHSPGRGPQPRHRRGQPADRVAPARSRVRITGRIAKPGGRGGRTSKATPTSRRVPIPSQRSTKRSRSPTTRDIDRSRA